MPPFLYDLLRYATGELKTMAHAPVLSIALLMIGFLLGLWVYKATHRERLQIASERLLLSEQQLKMSERPTSSLTEKQRQTIENLSALIAEGQDIRFRCPFPTNRTDFAKEHGKPWLVEWAAWIVKVHDLLRKDMAVQAMTKFQHITGIEGDLSMTSFPPSQCRILERQIQNLVDMMEKIGAYLNC